MTKTATSKWNAQSSYIFNSSTAPDYRFLIEKLSSRNEEQFIEYTVADMELRLQFISKRNPKEKFMMVRARYRKYTQCTLPSSKSRVANKNTIP